MDKEDIEIIKWIIMGIIGFIGFIFIIGIVSASYPGECYNLDFPNKEPVNFTLVYNSSSFEGFLWNKSGNIITYCFSKDFVPGNYTLSWNNSVERRVYELPDNNGGHYNPKPKPKPNTTTPPIDINPEDSPQDSEDNYEDLIRVIGFSLVGIGIILFVHFYIKWRREE